MAAQTREEAGRDPENEEFEDALDSLSPTGNLSHKERVHLDICIREADQALSLFFNNKFTLAKDRMQPWADVSMYHALGYGTILYIQAVMTFDMADIEVAIEAIKKSVTLCSKIRKKTSVIGSLTKFNSKVNYDEYTEEEIHAELVYAECLLIRAFLTFIQDENLISFVKGGLKIRECYKTYKECHKILQHRRVNTDKHRVHFESGVCMGVGAFNLMISLLPSKIMKLLEFVGFSGNKKLGLTEMQRACELHGGLRSKLCTLIFVAYHSLVTYVLGLGDGDIELATKLLEPCLRDHPKGALFLFFAGRLEEVEGHIDNAVSKFEESIDSQSEWRQFHHLCYWELMWCHCFKSDWLMAMKYAERLCKESRWSKATYTYQKAAFLSMCPDQTEDTRKHIDYLFKFLTDQRKSAQTSEKQMKRKILDEEIQSLKEKRKTAEDDARQLNIEDDRLSLQAQEQRSFTLLERANTRRLSSKDNKTNEVPRLKQRIAGKSLPFEKFAVAKSQRYFQQGNYLILPALELIYVWNGCNILGKNLNLLEKMLVEVEKTITEMTSKKDPVTEDKFYYDNYTLVLLLKGVYLRHRGQLFQAEQCFKEVIENLSSKAMLQPEQSLLEVIENEKKLQSDHYLIPYSIVELAILYLQQERFPDVKKLLDKAKRSYKGYYLENRLHFRIHAIRLQLGSILNISTDSAPSSPAHDSASNHLPSAATPSFDCLDD